MKLAIITPTCRENPRLAELARTLAYSLSQAPTLQLHWLIVDEKKREIEELFGLCDNSGREFARFGSETMDRFDVDVIEPLPSKYRQGPDKAPAHNSARSAGMMAALEGGADYIALINDCHVVTYNMLNVLADCSKQNLGYRARMHTVSDMPVPADGRIAYKDHHDLLRPIPVKTACGPLIGAPARAWADIRGFDLSYDGDDFGADLDAVIRLSRVGISFVTTERAFVIALRRTKTMTEISTRKEAAKGARNRQLINQLEREPKRVTPLWQAGDPEPKPVEVAKPEAEPESAEPKPRWKKRAPPVVGGRRQTPGTVAPEARPFAKRPPPVVGERRLPHQNQPEPRKPAARAPRPLGNPEQAVAHGAAVNPTPSDPPIDEIDDTPVDDQFDDGEIDDADPNDNGGDDLDGLDNLS